MSPHAPCAHSKIDCHLLHLLCYGGRNEQRNREVFPHIFVVKHILWNLKIRRKFSEMTSLSLAQPVPWRVKPRPCGNISPNECASLQDALLPAAAQLWWSESDQFEVKLPGTDSQVEQIMWIHLWYSILVFFFQLNFLHNIDYKWLFILSISSQTFSSFCLCVWVGWLVGWLVV